jgi:hypothetical protein
MHNNDKLYKQTWIQKAIPKTLLASQCFLEAYHMQKKNPGIEATICDFVNSTESAEIRNVWTMFVKGAI